MMKSAPVLPRFAAPAALLLAGLLLAGCASTSGQQRDYPVGSVTPAPPRPAPVTQPPPSRPVPISPGSAGDPSTAMIPPPRTLPAYPKTAEEVSGPAVLSLMKQARAAGAAGQYDQASGALERAQRIEPRNAFVWSALGRVYLQKKLYDNAESVAQKSNSLARGNIYVELENWKVIAAARDAQGDAAGSLQAQTRIDEIQRDLGGG